VNSDDFAQLNFREKVVEARSDVGGGGVDHLTNVAKF
jgi:hypothetical protein